MAIGDSNEALSHQLNQLHNLVLERLRLFILTHAPGLLHHDTEVVIRRSRRRQVSVVVNPLLVSHFTVVVSSSTIKTVKEFP